MVLLIEPFRPAADPGRARELWELQRASYRLEAALIGTDSIPPLREPLADLLAADLSWLCARDGARLCGAVACSVEDGVHSLDRLVVSPSCLRQGVGRALVTELLRRVAPRPTVVSTGRENVPARRLYESLGFAHQGDSEVETGLWLARYRHDPAERTGRRP